MGELHLITLLHLSVCAIQHVMLSFNFSHVKLYNQLLCRP